MENLYNEQFHEVDKLIAGNEFPIQVEGITLERGQGLLKRGTVLGKCTETGLYKVVDSTQTDGTEKAQCILTDDVDTGDEKATSDVKMTAYITGIFNESALIFGSEDTADNHREHLKELSIFLKEIL